MGFPWKQIAKIGLNVAGTAVGGPLPTIVRESQKHLGHSDDDNQGHDYVALGIRQIIAAAFPQALRPLDHIAASWASIAAQDHQQEEDVPEAAQSSIDLIKGYEGWRDKPYLCPAGEWTIGYGRNFEGAPWTSAEKRVLHLSDGGYMGYKPESISKKGTRLGTLPGRDWEREPLTREEGDYLLAGFYGKCAEQADVLLRRAGAMGERLLPEARDIVARMIYQMGYAGVSKFKNMLKALTQVPPDYERAAREMLDSRWAAQTSDRANHEADRMNDLVNA